MREFKKRRSQRGEITFLLLRGLGVLVLFAVTVVVVRAAWGMYGKLTLASEGQEQAESQLALLQAQQVQVGASVNEFSSARGMETEVRERFGVAKPGEGEIQIVEEAATSSTMPLQPQPWWQHVFHTLFVW